MATPSITLVLSPSRTNQILKRVVTISLPVEILLRTSSISFNHTSLHESINMSFKTTSSSSVYSIEKPPASKVTTSNQLGSSRLNQSLSPTTLQRPVILKYKFKFRQLSLPTLPVLVLHLTSVFSLQVSWDDYSEISMAHLRFLIIAIIYDWGCKLPLIPMIVDEGTTSFHCLKLYIK